MTKDIQSKEKYRIITAALLTMRLKARYRGFFYLREILILMINGEDFGTSAQIHDIKDIIPKALYIDVSKKLSVTIENIEKSIRVAINRMWETAEPGKEVDFFDTKYTFPQTKPTNTQVIYSAYLLVSAVLKKEDIA